MARKYNLAFYDSDALIEEKEGCGIRELFERNGEAYFRELEVLTIDKLTSLSTCIISTGGGAILSKINRDHLKSRTYCIYLRSTPEDLYRRLKNDRKRPLLQVENPLEALRNLFHIRDPLYRETAAYIVETGRPSVASLVNTISTQLKSMGLTEPV